MVSMFFVLVLFMAAACVWLLPMIPALSWAERGDDGRMALVLLVFLFVWAPLFALIGANWVLPFFAELLGVPFS